MTTCRIHSIETLGGVDGPGVRCVIFFQGCPLRCLYCQNPDTQRNEYGQEVSLPDLMRTIERTRPYFGPDGGVTLSGGEPLAQPEAVAGVLRACRTAGIHTAIDTSGACATPAAREAAALADLLLLDIKHPDTAICKALTGCGLEPALTLLEDAQARQQAVWVRHVVVPGWSDTPACIDELATLLAPFTCIQRIELLPYHRLAAGKYRSLGLNMPLPDTPATDPAAVQELQRQLNWSRNHLAGNKDTGPI